MAFLFSISGVPQAIHGCFVETQAQQTCNGHLSYIFQDNIERELTFSVSFATQTDLVGAEGVNLSFMSVGT